jgi:hypothetical protein
MDFVDKVYDLKLLVDKYGLLLKKQNGGQEFDYIINDDLCNNEKFFGYAFNYEDRPVTLWIPKEWKYTQTGYFKVTEWYCHERGEAKNWYDALLNQPWFWKWKVHRIDKLLNQTIKNCVKIRKKRKEEDIKLIAIRGDQEFVAKD